MPKKIFNKQFQRGTGWMYNIRCDDVDFVVELEYSASNFQRVLLCQLPKKSSVVKKCTIGQTVSKTDSYCIINELFRNAIDINAIANHVFIKRHTIRQ